MMILTREQQRSLWLHRAIASKAEADFEFVERTALSTLDRWRGVHREGGTVERDLEVWRQVIKSGQQAVIDACLDESELGCDLRQSNPFPGVLEPAERRHLLVEFQKHYDRALVLS